MKNVIKRRNRGKPTKTLFLLYLEKDIKRISFKKARNMGVSLASIMRQLLKDWVTTGAETDEK